MDKKSVAGVVLLVVAFALVGIYYDDAPPSDEEEAPWSGDEGAGRIEEPRIRAEEQDPLGPASDWPVAPEGDPEGPADLDGAEPAEAVEADPPAPPPLPRSESGR